MNELLAMMPLLLTLSATGILAGLLAGLLGVGGGIVIVPVLYFLLQSLGMSAGSAIALATGTSLATIIPTSLSSIRSQQARGNIDWALVKRWLPLMVVGVLIGSWLITQIHGNQMSIIFGSIAVLVSLNMLLRANAKPLLTELPSIFVQRILSFFVGALSVMAGIGGGTLSVPLFTAYNMKAHKAIGNASVFGFIIALPGALVMLIMGQTPLDAPAATYGLVNLIAVIAIVPLTIIFAPIGVTLGQKMNGALLKKIFAVFLMFTGIRMLSQFFGV
jgi:uncharacterized membrane protein YfcA